MASILVKNLFGGDPGAAGTYTLVGGVWTKGIYEFINDSGGAGNTEWELIDTSGSGTTLETSGLGDLDSPASASWVKYSVTEISSPGKLPIGDGSSSSVSSPGTLNPVSPGVPDKPENYVGTFEQALTSGQKNQAKTNIFGTKYPLFKRAVALAALGDSQTDRSSSATRVDSISYVTWLRILGGEKTPFVKSPSTGEWDFGYSGETAAEIMAHIDDVIASEADTVLVQAGINDITDGATAQETADNVIALWDRLLLAGKQVLAIGIFPQNLSGKQPTIDAANAILETAASSRSIPYYELPDSMRAGGVSGAIMDTAYMSDDTHLSARGCQVAAEFILEEFEPYLAKINPFPASDSASVISPSYSWEGGFDGANKPNDWTLVTGAATLAYAQEAATDGGPVWTKVTVSNNDANLSWLRLLVDSGFSVGETVQAIAEVELVSGTLNVLDLALLYQNASPALTTTANYSVNAATKQAQAFTSGVFLTPPAVVPGSTTQLRHQIQFYGNGVFRFRKAAVIKR